VTEPHLPFVQRARTGYGIGVAKKKPKRKPKKRGPKPEVLKIDLPPAEAMRRLLRPKTAR
jgi:hypothetical protein